MAVTIEVKTTDSFSLTGPQAVAFLDAVHELVPGMLVADLIAVHLHRAGDGSPVAEITYSKSMTPAEVSALVSAGQQPLILAIEES